MQNRTPIKWLYHNAKHISLQLTILTILGMLMSSIGVWLALQTKAVIDVVTKDVNGNFIEKISIMGILIGIQLVIQICYASLNVRVSGKLSISFKKRFFQSLLKKDWQSVSDYHSGELLNRINSDVGVVASGIMSIIPNTISFLTRIVFSFVALYFLDPTFALICLLIGPLIMIATRIYSKKMKSLHKKCQESDGKIRSFMQECLQNLLIIKSFKNEDEITENSTMLQMINYKFAIKRNNISILANIMFYLVLTAGSYFALAWCAYKISIGVMIAGTLVAIMQLVNQMQVPFKELSGLVPQYYAMLASSERIMEIEAIPDENGLYEDASNCEMIYEKMVGIQFRQLTFAYDNDNILEHVDFDIHKGEFIAISGISGIGKSTLLKLLLGIISPKEGEISLLMKDQTKIPLDKKVRGLFAYVPQGNMILSGTIRENISFSKEQVNDADIISAAKIAEIWDDIAALPKQLDTQIGEKGLGLSEGQIQRIAIARAVFYNAPIVLLDEATSALDEKTEKAVLANLKDMQTKTCIIVSHKKAAVDICDTSIYIKDGNIISHNI